MPLQTNNISFSFWKDDESLLIGGKSFGILAYAGTEASDYEIETRNHVQYDGAKMLAKRTLPREIMVEFEYVPWNGRGNMRQQLISFFDPKTTGRLTVKIYGTAREISYEVKSFRVQNQDLFEKLRCLLYLQCLDPYFQSTEQICEKISTLIGGWKWKFTLPFRMKQYGPLEKVIVNNGHLPAPVEIFFRGPAVNPKIVNHRTGQYLRLKRTLTTDDSLYISTAYGKKTVEIRTEGGSTEDGWDYLDLESEFFWLQKGENRIEYSGEDESVRSRGVEVRYRELFFGV